MRGCRGTLEAETTLPRELELSDGRTLADEALCSVRYVRRPLRTPPLSLSGRPDQTNKQTALLTDLWLGCCRLLELLQYKR